MVQQKKASLSWVFARKGISPKNGLGLLQIRVYLDRTKQKYISTGEHLSEVDWALIEAALKDSKKERKLYFHLKYLLGMIKHRSHPTFVI
jgi:hypothetical protein